jgi:hypothetical protein
MDEMGTVQQTTVLCTQVACLPRKLVRLQPYQSLRLARISVLSVTTTKQREPHHHQGRLCQTRQASTILPKLS